MVLMSVSVTAKNTEDSWYAFLAMCIIMTGGEGCQLCVVNIFSLSLACFSILVASFDEKIRLTLMNSNLSFVFVLYILWVLVSKSLPTTKS